ncbi:hypothetical protein GCM10009579_36760 [Streptomyces javensis]|uniref:Uncharacterized protein n=1 Tax=Streptomyces javensis TaxID=114698 RepID=A0ABN1WZX3_9ACTN
MSSPTATRLHAADASVTVVSNTVFVTDWARRYFGPWWNAYTVDAENISRPSHRRRRQGARSTPLQGQELPSVP